MPCTNIFDFGDMGEVAHVSHVKRKKASRQPKGGSTDCQHWQITEGLLLPGRIMLLLLPAWQATTAR